MGAKVSKNCAIKDAEAKASKNQELHLTLDLTLKVRSWSNCFML